mmetsp:Transcript_48040/g.115455  ORF Transcript_48040/g.115455 Transcript_48040/m.115455 type:complete len:214 (-) Transcript_48040:97-738(-)
MFSSSCARRASSCSLVLPVAITFFSSTFLPHSPFFLGLGNIMSSRQLPVPPVHCGLARLPVTAVSNTVMKELSEYWLKECTLLSSDSRKNISEPRAATGLYISRLALICSSVAAASTILDAISPETRFESSRFSMSSRFSSTSPSALASCERIPVSSSCILILFSFCCRMSSAFCSSRSGRSLATVSASSWSSRPSSVTAKLMRVVSACISGG